MSQFYSEAVWAYWAKHCFWPFVFRTIEESDGLANDASDGYVAEFFKIDRTTVAKGQSQSRLRKEVLTTIMRRLALKWEDLPPFPPRDAEDASWRFECFKNAMEKARRRATTRGGRYDGPAGPAPFLDTDLLSELESLFRQGVENPTQLAPANRQGLVAKVAGGNADKKETERRLNLLETWGPAYLIVSSELWKHETNYGSTKHEINR